jgi:VCBS repeat-containing protein
VVLSITGTNDTPVITSAAQAGAVQEDSLLTTSGQISSSDVDNGATAAWSVQGAATGTYGDITVDATGKWTYTLANGTNGVASAVQALAAGERHDEAFTIRVTDDKGGFADQVVTVTVNGTNDAAIITGGSAASLTETNAVLTASGQLSATDVDSSNLFVVQSNAAGNHGYGSFSINAAGAWTYAANTAHNEFVSGTTYTDSVTVATADGTTQVITVSILGTNDVAIISGGSTASVSETNAVLTASGQLSATDVDSSNLFVVQSNAAGSHGYGSFSINAAGAWTYAANTAHNEFVGGTTYTDSVTVATADGTMQVLTVTIAGTNDAPVAPDVTLLVNQLGNGGFEATPDFSGWTVSAATSGLSYLYKNTTVINRSGNSLAGDNAVAVLTLEAMVPNGYGTGYGSTITSDAFVGQAGDTVKFVYELSAGSDQAKGTGYIRDAATHAIVQTIFDYLVPVVGSTGVQTVNLTLAQSGNFVIDFRVGSYDATGGTVIGATLKLGFAGIIRDGLAEDSAFTFAGSNFLSGVTDVDGGTAVLSSVSAASAHGASVALVGGSVMYNAAGAFDFLAANESLVDIFQFTVSDGKGGFDASTASVKVTGTNDAPVVAAALTSAASEGAASYGVNLLDRASDVDNGETATLHIASVTYKIDGGAASGVVPSGLSLSGNTLTVNPADAAFDSLAAGVQKVITVSYNVTDAHGATVAQTETITVTGTNDTPVVVAVAASGLEDAASIAVTLSGSDVDGTVAGYIISSLPANGVLYSDAALTQVIAVNSTVSSATVYFKPVANFNGSTGFNYSATDNSGASSAPASVTISVTAVNDAPVAINDSNSATEAGGIGNGTPGSNASGNVLSNDTDVDTSLASFRVTALHAGAAEGSGATGTLGSALAGAYGNLTLNADGSYNYVLNNSAAAVQALNVGAKLTDTFNYTMTDGSLNDAALLTVTISGANDAPVAVADSGTSISANGSVNVSFSPIGSAYASGVGNEYVITQAVNSQVGALWSNSKVSLNASFSISAELFFGASDSGADGFSFIIQNNSKATIGASGEGLGYAGIANSVGIEFDTYFNNGTTDIANDHAAFNTGGRMNAIDGVINLGNIEDNQYHAVQIDWNATSHVVTLSYGGAVIGSRTIDVAAQVGANEAYIGFAGSTGGSTNLQKIHNLSYQSANNSVVLDVLVNDTDVDSGDKAGLKVVAATSDHGATVVFSGMAGAGINYSPGHAFDYLAINKTVIDTVTYIIQDMHGAQATSTVQVAISGVNAAPTVVQTVLGNSGNNILTGSALADYINGLSGNDTLTGLDGNDLLTGGAGSDRFVFNKNEGDDTITDFTGFKAFKTTGDAADQIVLNGMQFKTFNDIIQATKDNLEGNAVIQFSAKNSITLIGVHKESLDASDFMFA